MSSLLNAELLRLFSRRLLIVLLVGMAALAAFGSAILTESVRPLTGEDRQIAQESFDAERGSWEEECVSVEVSSVALCDDWEFPTDIGNYLRTPTDFGLYGDSVVEFGLAVMLLAVSILAASLVGAEFSSGNVGTQLLFTPRRIPLSISKLVAATVGGLLLAVAYLATALGLSAIMFLSLRGADAMTVGSELPMALGRALVLTVLIAVMAGSLAMAFGSTLIPFGVFGVTLLGSITMADTVGSGSALQPFLPTNILMAMMYGQHQIFDYDAPSFNGELVVAHAITYDWALGCSVVGAALILLGALWWFRRRDIIG